MNRRLVRGRMPFVEEGVSSPRVFALAFGQARVYHISRSGRERTTQLMRSRSLIGLCSCLTQSPPPVSIRAIGDCLVDELHGGRLRELLVQIPQLSHNVNRMLAGLVIDLLARQKLTIDAAPIRLGRILVMLAVPSPNSDGSCEIKGLTHEDLGSMVGVTRTWITLTLATFQRAGLLSLGRGVIRIHALEIFENEIEKLAAGSGGE